ncbi:MAG: alcohol dehydrogenase catalytic domain-containing protein [Parvibaculum sp.]|uniref:alcohol dehydrogenase n=1 Tax=Parvibaculum sp. TaxID=2024848 RepID=UPI001DD18DA8|nr:alcohol dehydrogenase [Parvibaculum sp.]MBX3491066.1 alcohol dehydrogenase catalytic domain-containing protein [Parvibaculum sp.]MBX3497615.1 alcohol dehydrogenase catalytic domain-containing protein [Parvibaculum sp.]MCW5728886.1 alcohol dehydrogenase catalytic domain-containing protein [Parvibaculum sp.]
MKSEAIVDYGQALKIVESETPKPQGSEVLLKVTHCGVCHSDVHIHDGYFDMGGGNKLDVRGGRQLPFTLGHEIEGEVVAVGPDAQGVEIGAHRVAYPWIGCGECPTCKRGDEHLCNKPRNLGIHVAGGYATHVIVPHPRYLIDYTGVADGLAATYMCSGLTAYGAMKKLGDISAEERVMVVGLGGVGMMGLQFAKAMFPAAPLGADVDDSKLQAAKGSGAHEVYNPKDPEAIKKVLADTNGGVPAAVDFVGSEASLKFATSIVRKGGQVVIVGLFGGGFSMPIPMFPMRALTIGGSYVGSLGETHEMMDLVKAGKIDPIPVSERPLGQGSQALDDLRKGSVMGRVVLKP